MAGTPERERIGRWLGYEGEVTRLISPRITETEHSGRVRFDFSAMESKSLLRVPFSLHEDTQLAARPVTQSDLYRFEPERDASADRTRRLRRRFEIPVNFARTVSRDLSIQEEE